MLDEIGKAVPAYAGIRWETLGEGGLQWTPAHWRSRPRRVEPVEIAAIAAPAAGSYLLVSSPVLWDGGTVDGARRRAGAQAHGGAVHRVESRRPGRGRPDRRPES